MFFFLKEWRIDELGWRQSPEPCPVLCWNLVRATTGLTRWGLSLLGFHPVGPTDGCDLLQTSREAARPARTVLGSVRWRQAWLPATPTAKLRFWTWMPQWGLVCTTLPRRLRPPVQGCHHTSGPCFARDTLQFSLQLFLYVSLADRCFTILCWSLPSNPHASAVGTHLSSPS